MGGVINSIFGGGNVSMPDMPESEPAPVAEAEKDPVAKSVRDTEKRRIMSRRAMSGTLLSGGQGASQGSDRLGLLGHTLK